ncbi:hypothetical protein Tco_1221904, partial [Tanacetum coccineum]
MATGQSLRACLSCFMRNFCSSILHHRRERLLVISVREGGCSSIYFTAPNGDLKQYIVMWSIPCRKSSQSDNEERNYEAKLTSYRQWPIVSSRVPVRVFALKPKQPMVMPANRIAPVLALKGKVVGTAVYVKKAMREIHIFLLAAKIFFCLIFALLTTMSNNFISGGAKLLLPNSKSGATSGKGSLRPEMLWHQNSVALV